MISNALMLVTLLALSGCNQGSQNTASQEASTMHDSASNERIQETPTSAAAPVAVRGQLVDAHTYRLCGKTYTTKGNFSVDAYNRNATGVVTFTGFPASYEEFADLYENFLGKTPEGTAAMATMAMELFYRDKAVGEKCVTLLCSPGSAAGMKSIVGEKVRSWKRGDPYGQRYLPAAVLKGATAENGYLPTDPYTIEMKASVNKHEKVQISDNGICMYIYVLGDGWDSHQRSVQVFLRTGGDHYKIWAASSLYVQCKNSLKDFKDLK